jgi:hypothetical protein
MPFGFRVQGLEFRIQGSGPKIQGLGLSLGFRDTVGEE